MRSEPNEKAGLVGKVYPGEKFDYSETSNDWYKIMLSGEKPGWVLGQFVELLK